MVACSEPARTRDEPRLWLLYLPAQSPGFAQSQCWRALGVSPDSTQHALQALLGRGWVKAQNFTRSDNKRAYLYKLTPKGLTEKTRLAYRFLQKKRAEHEVLMAEIEALQAEVASGEL